MILLHGKQQIDVIAVLIYHCCIDTNAGGGTGASAGSQRFLYLAINHPTTRHHPSDSVRDREILWILQLLFPVKIFVLKTYQSLPCNQYTRL